MQANIVPSRFLRKRESEHLLAREKHTDNFPSQGYHQRI